jgi:hypothetical protein
VGVHVGLQVEFCEKLARTLTALEPFDALMHLHMLIQVGSLRECELTAWLLTLEWAFSCVDPQVVKEIMPLFECFHTAVVRAQQLFNYTFTPRVFHLKY